MKILVTGGLGYIGSHTCVELAKENHDLIIVDKASKEVLRQVSVDSSLGVYINNVGNTINARLEGTCHFTNLAGSEDKGALISRVL